MMKRRHALAGSTLCFILAAPGWSVEPPGQVAPLKGVKYLGNHVVPSDARKRVTRITGAHYVSAGDQSAGTLYLLSGDAGAGFFGSNGWGKFSKPRYFQVDMTRVILDTQRLDHHEFLPSEVVEHHITEGKHAYIHPLWLNDGHIAPSSITTTEDGKLLIASSQGERDFTGFVDYRVFDIPAYVGYGYQHANRYETRLDTRNNGFLKAWFDAHGYFPVPVIDLIPAAFLHLFREIPIQLSKGVHWFDLSLSSQFLLTNSDALRAGQVDGAFRLPKHYESIDWIPLLHGKYKGIQQGMGVKSLDHIPGSNHYVSATAGALAQDANQWTIKGIVPPARVVTFTTEQMAKEGQLLARQYINSEELPAKGEVMVLSEKLYNFSLLTVKPSVRKQLKSNPIRTISDIAVLNKNQALFLEKTALPYKEAPTRYVTRVYLVDLNSGKNFRDKAFFDGNQLNTMFMNTPEDFLKRTLVFDSINEQSFALLPNSPDFNLHFLNFEAITLGPDTLQGDKTFMLVSHADGKVYHDTHILHFVLPPGQQEAVAKD